MRPGWVSTGARLAKSKRSWSREIEIFRGTENSQKCEGGFFSPKDIPFFKAPLTSEGEAVEKTAANMRVVAPVPRPQMMRKVFLVGKKTIKWKRNQEQPAKGVSNNQLKERRSHLYKI